MNDIPVKHVSSPGIEALGRAVLDNLTVCTAQHSAVCCPGSTEAAVVVIHDVLLQLGIDQLEMLAGRIGRLNRRHQALGSTSGHAGDFAIGQRPGIYLHLIDTAAIPIRGLPCRRPTTDTHRLVAGHDGAGNR